MFLHHAFLRVSIKNTSIGKIGFTEEQKQSDSWKQNNLLSVSSFIKGLQRGINFPKYGCFAEMVHFSFKNGRIEGMGRLKKFCFVCGLVGSIL